MNGANAVTFVIVENDEHKETSIREFLNRDQSARSVLAAKSLNAGMQLIREQHLKCLSSREELVVILDMQLTVHDERSGGGSAVVFGGRDILRMMKYEGIVARTVVVTQFQNFGRGPDRVTIEQLRVQCGRFNPESFRGIVYYQPKDADWMERLRAVLGLKGDSSA